jgi:hypothetical protein
MLFTTRHGRNLAEIRALTSELDRRSRLGLDRVERIARELGLSQAPAPGGGPLIAFVHIPKTAGGTVSAMFLTAYSNQGLHKAGNYMRGPEQAIGKVSKSPEAWRAWRGKGGRVSMGHMPYAAFRGHMPPDTLYMTFLREPVDRVLSHYHRHIARRNPRRAGQSGNFGRVRAESLEHAFEIAPERLSDLQTRFLCDRPDHDGPLPASAVDEAKRNLSTFEFVGLQEHFDESMARLKRVLGLEAIGSDAYESRHVSSDRPTVDELPADERALIAEHNRLDAELYEFAQSLFERSQAVVA